MKEKDNKQDLKEKPPADDKEAPGIDVEPVPTPGQPATAPGDGAAPGGESVTVSAHEWEQLKREAQEYKDKWVRLYAEFENSRKRNERERLEFIKYAKEDIICEFLDVLDDLERSVSAAAANRDQNDNFLKGVELVMARIHDMLKRNKVVPIEAVGKVFDPHLHEIMMQEQTSEHEEGVILEEFQKGFMLGEKVIRTSKVKVAVKK